MVWCGCWCACGFRSCTLIAGSSHYSCSPAQGPNLHIQSNGGSRCLKGTSSSSKRRLYCVSFPPMDLIHRVYFRTPKDLFCWLIFLAKDLFPLPCATCQTVAMALCVSPTEPVQPLATGGSAQHVAMQPCFKARLALTEVCGCMGVHVARYTRQGRLQGMLPLDITDDQVMALVRSGNGTRTIR